MDDKSFLGKSADDDTGLTHVGAREYDPSIGRFISVDPLLELDKHQSLNGYGYSENNPATLADPSGLGTPECMSGVITGCTNGVPDSDSVYHPEREGQGTASTSSTGSGTGTGGSVEYDTPVAKGCGFWDMKCGWDQLWHTECGFWGPQVRVQGKLQRLEERPCSRRRGHRGLH